MKTFEIPEIQVIEFTTEDIMTLSSNNPDQLPMG